MTVSEGPAPDPAPAPVLDHLPGPRLVKSLLENTLGLLLGMRT